MSGSISKVYLVDSDPELLKTLLNPQEDFIHMLDYAKPSPRGDSDGRRCISSNGHSAFKVSVQGQQPNATKFS